MQTGMFAFRTMKNKKPVSIFIHFLNETMNEKGSKIPLNDLLLEVSFTFFYYEIYVILILII